MQNTTEGQKDNVRFLSRSQERETLEREISERQKRLKELRAEHEEHVLKASLLLNAEYEYGKRFRHVWHKKKQYVLLALKSERVPAMMRWGVFEHSFPNKLCLDRDVLLARLELDDFETMYANKLYPVSPKFRDDKDVMMAVCSKNCLALSLASKTLSNDPDVVLAAIRQTNSLAPMTIQYASHKLRGDKKVVRVALNHEFGIRCVKYIAPRLQQDKRLILTSIRRSSAECSLEYEHLRELPEALRRDGSIVMAALKKRGSNLRYVVAPELLDDLDMALAACKQDVKAFNFVPKSGPTRRELLKGMNLHAIIANGGGSILKHASATSQTNKTLLLQAVANGLNSLDLKHLPPARTFFRKERAFFIQLLRANGNLYMKLPIQLQQNIDIALECLSSDILNNHTALDIMRRHEDLRSDLDVMASIAKRGFADVLRLAPIDVRDNKALMLEACSVHGSLISLASHRLRTDPEVVTTALTADPDTVFALTNQKFFENNPDVVKWAIQLYNGDDFGYDILYHHLPATVFQDRMLLLAWLSRDWPKVDSFIYKRLLVNGGYTNDREVLLAILAQSGSLSDLGCDELLRDREFMEKAVKVDGRVLMDGVTTSWLGDFDLLLKAVASSRLTLQPLWHYGNVYDSLVALAALVRERLDITDVFMMTFLRGITVIVPHVAPALRCYLPKLDQGNDASIKLLIADYAGIPYGEELCLHRSASANLEYWGY